MTAQSNTPTLIKRKRVVKGDGHHGGAWKVAYADFVTAMMAFFMLMWLLGATTEKQRKGIADYFNPTISVVRASAGGQGAFGGESVYSENTLAQNGTGAGLPRPTEARQARGNLGTSDGDGSQNASADTLSELERQLLAAGGESMSTELLRRHVVTRISDEGLVVEIFDTEDTPMFTAQNEPTETFRALMEELLPVFGLVENDIAVNGHVRAQPVVVINDNGWETSLARAAAARQKIEEKEPLAGKVQRMTGYASRAPIDRNPMAVRNNRIEIIVLRETA
ncbi:MAG: flagellar motor protein MotB [Pseudomonadota bacterium]